MELKLNSWYVWLWNYTYPENLPNNLCPLFWKLVVAILLFPINLVLRIPVNIINLVVKDYDKIERGDARTGIGIVMYIIFILALFVISTLYHWALWLFNAYSYDSTAATMGGFFISVGIFFIIRYYWLKHNTKDKIVDKTTNNIIVNYTKSWYNNHCPKINWK